jgi:HEAT repeat protein
VEQSWWQHLRRRLRRTTVDSAVADLTGGSRHQRSNAAIWVWAGGRDRFSAAERARLIGALEPIAERDEVPVCAAQAIAALVALGANGAVELAIAALQDPRPEVRHLVAAQLRPTGDRRVVEALITLLDDPDGFVREAATMGLEGEGDPAALEPLRAMARRERADRVAKAGAKRAIKALEKTARGR